MYYAVTDGKGIITLITRQHLKKMYKKKAEDSKMEKKNGDQQTTFRYIFNNALALHQKKKGMPLNLRQTAF